eukprot:sb/3476839/
MSKRSRDELEAILGYKASENVYEVCVSVQHTESMLPPVKHRKNSFVFVEKLDMFGLVLGFGETKVAFVREIRGNRNKCNLIGVQETMRGDIYRVHISDLVLCFRCFTFIVRPI